jgi:hypothetical protein
MLWPARCAACAPRRWLWSRAGDLLDPDHHLRQLRPSATRGRRLADRGLRHASPTSTPATTSRSCPVQERTRRRWWLDMGCGGNLADQIENPCNQVLTSRSGCRAAPAT